MPRPLPFPHWLVVLSALAVAGCAGVPRRPVSEALPLPDAVAGPLEALPERPAAVSAAPDPGAEITLRALAELGVRYRFGGTTPETGFDCSGLVRWVFRDHPTLALPRASADMARMPAPSVGPGELAPGDLVFFRIRGSRVSHVGIYVGGGRFVHAPSRGAAVRIDRLDDRYWKRRWAGARRVLARSQGTSDPVPRAAQ
ncbi:MAG: C40 family peptidase [Pseudomonadota bacterium]|jgi:murein DD-endopeptidase